MSTPHEHRMTAALSGLSAARRQQRRSRADRKTERALSDVTEKLLEIRRCGELRELLIAELLVISTDLEDVANTPSMESSLESARVEIAVALELADKVLVPETYQEVDASYRLPRNRPQGLPRDEARQFFATHRTRLMNLERGYGSDSTKSLLSTRRGNMAAAQRIYAQLQTAALGPRAYQAAAAPPLEAGGP